ncbi:MAG TPA: chemotaxis protein CheA [Bryobacteraceae bacterium]|jgi:two-component system chemotaxis sensor kinase CheA|nr:chemotaxis protein CheA [Bryobacteraceae bacterium]
MSVSADPNSASVNPLASDPELIGDFIMESREHLTAIELQLLTLDQDPANSEAINAIFRGFHTIKGMAGFLDLDPVRDLAHEVETVLDLARNAKLTIDSTIIDRILESKDYLNVWMTELEEMLWTGKTPAGPEAAGLLEAIRGLVTGAPEIPAAPLVGQAAAQPASPGLMELAREVAAPLVADTAPETAPAEVVEASKTSEARAVGARSIKVETAKLDYLVDMVGEMVISQSLVRHDPDLSAGLKPRLARNLSQLARITDDIQRTAMSMRMIPVGQLFQKTSRLVRDLSRKAGKLVELELAGEETELDRNIVEELADPLMHMVRNSVDHGIEVPADRVAAGKPAQAHVTLKAGHQAGHIVIQISDDGRGLAREKILRKAREKNLIEPGVELSESEIFALIFHPGFSTADKITDVSGRGVGMDVVRKQVQKLRGRIDVISKPGEGTTFLLKLPLTLAIIDGLVVGVGDQRYIVPIFAVREMLRPAKEAISTIHGRQEMALVRGSLIPVIRLHQRFQVKPKNQHPWESLLIVTENGSKLFGLMVDELIGKQEVVIKSLGEGMRHIAGVAGGAILGDGRVGLILDPEGLFGSSNGASHGE